MANSEEEDKKIFTEEDVRKIVRGELLALAGYMWSNATSTQNEIGTAIDSYVAHQG